MTRYVYQGPARSKEPLHIDDDTALWLMRMVVGEGGKKCPPEKTSALCWAIVHRWFLWPGRRHYETFVSMIRAFSQPINPRWAKGGDLAIKYAGKASASPARLARRARITGLTDSEMPLVIKSAVWAFEVGELIPPLPLQSLSPEDRLISNWASLKSTPTKYPWGIDIQGDWFFRDRNLDEGKVVVDNGEL